MKISLCCSVVPIEFATGISSLDMGLCPRCSEHTEFVDLLYKVRHEYGGEEYTTNPVKAREIFDGYKKDGCDQVRLYEGLSTSDDTDEIDWELIDCYNVAFKEEEVYENN